MPATGNEAERLWRKLYTELAVLLDLHYTDQQVVDLFYEFGVIDAPTVPAGMKSIRDYVIETLHHGYAIPGFLRVAVPKVVFDLDMEDASVDAITGAMEGLGSMPPWGESLPGHRLISKSGRRPSHMARYMA